MSDDGTALAVACSDARIRIIDSASGTVVATLAGHCGGVTRLRFVDDGPHRLLSASADGTVRLWDVDAAICLHVMEDHRGSVDDIAVGRGGETLVSSSSDGTIRVWDGRSGRGRQVIEHEHENEHGFSLGGLRLALTCLDRMLLVGSGAGAGRQAVTGDDLGRLLLWDLDTPPDTPGSG